MKMFLQISALVSLIVALGFIGTQKSQAMILDIDPDAKQVNMCSCEDRVRTGFPTPPNYTEHQAVTACENFANSPEYRFCDYVGMNDVFVECLCVTERYFLSTSSLTQSCSDLYTLERRCYDVE